MNPSSATGPSIGFWAAFVRGVRLTLGLPRVFGMAVLAEGAAGLLSFAVQALLLGLVAAAAQRAFVSVVPDPLLPVPLWFVEAFLRELSSSRAWLPTLGAGLAAAVLVAALRLLWLTFAVRVFAARVTEEALAPGLAPAAERFHRAAAAAVLLVPVWLAAALFRITALGATGLAFGHALVFRQGGVPASGGLALALVLVWALDLLLSTLSRLTLVRAVAVDEGPLQAIAGAARIMTERLGTAVSLIAMFAVLQAMAFAAGQSGNVLVSGTGVTAIGILLAARALGGAMHVLLQAAVATAEVGALVTLEASVRGVLPQPPAPLPPDAISGIEAIYETEVIHETELVLPTREA